MGIFEKNSSQKKNADPPMMAPAAKGESLLGSEVSPTQSTKGQKKADVSVEPTIDMVPQLVKDLAGATDTSGDKPARALRMLFALSEHQNDSKDRVTMVRKADGKLVPVLFDFLTRCERGSSEQYLTLLVLNNLSIPSENKRFIALDCGGARVFARLLCEDPSCHLMAIILVNLTFADAELRKELVSTQSNIQLVESLSFALRVASLTHDEYEARQPLVVGDVQDGEHTPSDLLVALMAEDQRLRPALSDLDYNSAHNFRGRDLLLNPAHQLFPETARWCLSALKNLTRPSKDLTAAHVLINTGVVHLIMRFVTVGGMSRRQMEVRLETSENHGSQSSSSESPTPADPTIPYDAGEFINTPSRWDSNSMQDAALFVVMNLSALPSTREAVRDLDGVHLLSCIAECSDTIGEVSEYSVDEAKQLEFQCLKARMALAYLVGSEGHFGQPRVTSTNVYSSPNDSVLILTDTEVNLIVELLSNTFHQRTKEGPGGYSAATFSTKWVLYAIRCLLTHTMNQIQFVNTAGAKLNVLLMKVLAQHAIQNVAGIDADAAEHACFSLYLQSGYGFKTRFLPAMFGNPSKIAASGSLSAKVLTSYLHMENITPAGRHAADQLLLRLRYLSFKGTISDLANPTGMGPTLSDFHFDDELLAATESIIVERRGHGAKPRDDIFDRPILRSRAPKRGTHRAPWDNRASVSAFPSALHAVQQLSYGSTKVRHMDAIDDVLIANNIANSANGEKTESYNYWWSWQDAAGEIQRNLERQRSYDSTSIFSTRGQVANPDEPVSIFGFDCGRLCSDT